MSVIRKSRNHARGRELRRQVTLVAFLVLIAGAAFPQRQQPSEEQLKKWLQNAPEADANHDGKLTAAEAQAYRQKRMGKQRPQQGGAEAPTSPTTSRSRQAQKPAPDYPDVKYGPYERNLLDVWLAKSDKPAPVVIYIHGGGFVHGDKSGVPALVLQECLKSQISVASIIYRFISTDPFPAPQHDGARAVQFIRSKAKEWNIDPAKVAAFGGSAGAGISLFLAFHDDMADPMSSDTVLRQSTRLTCAGSFSGQTSYDPLVIQQWIGGRAAEHPSILLAYRCKSPDEFKNPALQKTYDEVSAIKHLTKDDPPVFMFYTEPDRPLPAEGKPGQGIHHPIFGHKLKEKMDALGIENVYHHKDQYQGDPYMEMLEFFKKQFAKK